MSRRRFIATAMAAVPAAIAARVPGVGAAWSGGRVLDARTRRSLGFPVPEEGWHGDSSVGAAARLDPRLFRAEEDPPRLPPPLPPPPTQPQPSEWQQFAAELAVFGDLRRHFIFEYYPWYQTAPWRHWNEAGRTPPIDIAAFAVPALGAYDSRDAKAIEQQARWIAEAGAGAVNLSWWGQGSAEDRAVPLIMDVMHAHDIHVTFHLEPYADNRADRFAADVLYLIREYGEKRRWDAFLLLEDAGGVARPIFKTFRTILAPTATDCHGQVFPVPDFTADGVWRRQIDALRSTLSADLDPVLLADSVDTQRMATSGFDGTALYDPYYRPADWPAAAASVSSAQLLFSFNVNAGFDRYPDRPPFGDCYSPRPFEPPIDAVGWSPEARAAALDASRGRVLDSLRTTLSLQLDPALANVPRGFFVTYINSFNEWHEGTAFEPAADFASLSPELLAIGYHNPDNGQWRLQLLQDVMSELTNTQGSRL